MFLQSYVNHSTLVYMKTGHAACETHLKANIVGLNIYNLLVSYNKF